MPTAATGSYTRPMRAEPHPSYLYIPSTWNTTWHVGAQYLVIK